MKKPIFIIASLLLLFSAISCNSKNGENKEVKDIKSTGREVYLSNCKACHQENGKGLTGTFPPLANSDYLLFDKARAIKQVLAGSSCEMTVNGVKYNGTMPPQNLTDEQVASVLNFVMHAWDNNGPEVTVDDVMKTH